MEVIFTNPGFSHISDKVVKYLPLRTLSKLSKTSKSMATATARFWLPRFFNRYQLEPQLEDLYTYLMSHQKSEIQQSLGYITRFRIEHGDHVFSRMMQDIELELKGDFILPTNCPLILSIILNQEPLAELILSQSKFLFSSIEFSTAVILGILGFSSMELLKSLVVQWIDLYPYAEEKNDVLDFALEKGLHDKFKKLLDFGLVPSAKPGLDFQNDAPTLMDSAVVKGQVEIVKVLLPFYKGNLERPMLLAIYNDRQKVIEVLFDHCKIPASPDMKKLSSNNWKYTNYSWSYYAAVFGKYKTLQEFIALEGQSPLPSSEEEQFLFLSEIILRGSEKIKRYVYDHYEYL